MTPTTRTDPSETPAASPARVGEEVFGTRPDASALRLLRDPGCPACASAVESEHAYWFWFNNESHNNPEVLAQLARSLGWCPAHTRAFLALAVSHTANNVFAAITPAARRRLNEGSALGDCPACLQVGRASEAAVTTVLAAMHDQRVRNRYSQHGGFCLPHARRALAGARDPAIRILLLQALDALLRSPGVPVSALTVPDSDGERRASLRARMLARMVTEPSYESARDVTVALRASFDVDCCSVCAAAARAETQLLNWLPGAWRAEPTTIEREYAETCSPHLLDLAALDRQAASAVLRSRRSRRLHEIGTCREDLTAGLGRGHRHRRWPDTACDPLLRDPPPCPICSVAGDAESSHLRLLEAALRDTATRAAYESSCGMCARHFSPLGADAPTPVRSVIDARLAITSWALDEASRKAAWARRFEPMGAERHAWRRAPALLDGRVYLGNPPETAEERQHGDHP